MVARVNLGGHFKPDVYNLPSSMSEEYGIEAANEIAEFELANLEAVQNYVRSSGAKCDFVLTKAVDVQLSESHDKSLKARYDRFLSAGGKAAKNATRIEGDNAEKVRLNALHISYFATQRRTFRLTFANRCSESRERRARSRTPLPMRGHTS